MKILENNSRKNRLIKKLREENQRLKNPFYPLGRVLAVCEDAVAIRKAALENKKNFSPGGVVAESCSSAAQRRSTDVMLLDIDKTDLNKKQFAFLLEEAGDIDPDCIPKLRKKPKGEHTYEINEYLLNSILEELHCCAKKLSLDDSQETDELILRLELLRINKEHPGH